MTRSETSSYAIYLWLLLALFCGRVLGQVLVAFWAVPWLPPMNEWQSGLLPYPLLLASQIVIIVVFTKICIDLTRGEGRFSELSPRWGKGLFVFGTVYFSSMVLRYIITMWLRPERRWFGGTIPIVFHLVLASFILILSRYHLRAATLRSHSWQQT